MNCPNCNASIQKSDINIQADIAQCYSCERVFKISEHLETDNSEPFDIHSPPKGAWIRKEMHALKIGATTRSGAAFFLVPFMTVWSGLSLGGIYGMQLINGEFDPVLSLFGIPFVLGSLIFWALALMSIAGKVELTLDNAGGKIFTGLGRIGITQRFSWDTVSNVTEKTKLGSRSTSTAIYLEGQNLISFGTGLTSARRYYLLRALQVILRNRKAKKQLV